MGKHNLNTNTHVVYHNSWEKWLVGRCGVRKALIQVTSSVAPAVFIQYVVYLNKVTLKKKTQDHYNLIYVMPSLCGVNGICPTLTNG